MNCSPFFNYHLLSLNPFILIFYTRLFFASVYIEWDVKGTEFEQSGQ